MLKFKGNGFLLLLYYIAAGLVSAISFGILAPLAYQILTQWTVANVETTNGDTFEFTATTGDIYLKALLVVGLTLITLGLYLLYFPVALFKYTIENIKIYPSNGDTTVETVTVEAIQTK